jgi:hypothetical protein
MEEPEIFEAEAVIVGGRLVLTAVLKNLVPDGERVFLMLPALFAAEIRDRGVEPYFLCGHCGLIGDIRLPIRSNESVCGMSDEGDAIALRESSEESLKIVLLFGGELSRIADDAGAHAKAP